MAYSLAPVRTPISPIPAHPLLDDGSLGWISEAISVITAALPFITAGDGGANKNFHAMDDAAKSIVSTYHVDIVADSKAMGVDPNLVITALSDYLRDEYKINIPVSKIIEDQKKYGASSLVNSNMTPIILGGGALLLFFLLMRKRS